MEKLCYLREGGELGIRAYPFLLHNLLQNEVINIAMKKQKQKLLFHLWSKHFFVSSLLYFPLHFAVNYEVELEMLLGDYMIMSGSLLLI